jgi:hypothetical protein
MLKIPLHSYGFFSCCSITLYHIINYFNTNKKLPLNIDNTDNFVLYNNNSGTCINHFFFKTNNNDIQYINDVYINLNNNQFENYYTVNYNNILPFIEKYFSPSLNIINIYNHLIKKYNINIDNCIGLYYRGTDKYTETTIGSYEIFYEKLINIIDNKNITIIIQSDSYPFLNYITNKNIKNVIIINENKCSYSNLGIHNENTKLNNFNEIQYLFATFLIISKCKYIICSSGNCSIWIMYYRGNANNVYQCLGGIFIN